MRFGVRLALAAALFVAFVGQVAAADSGLAVDLSTAQSTLTTSDDVSVRVTFRNIGGRHRAIYSPQTPLVEVEHDLFDVRRGGESVAYLGIEAKRGQPAAEDFVTLGRGRSLSADVELTALYDMSQPGSYTVQFRASAHALLASARSAEVVSSNVLALEITGEARPSPLDSPFAFGGEAGVQAATYSKCTASQTSALQTALPAAQQYAANASSYLTANGANGRYTLWFGTATTTRVNKVKANLSAIASALDTQQIAFDCGCKKQYYAYVYPSQPYKIYLCRAFWTAPMTGTDSKAGTIVHEASHFNVVAGTDDHAYGHSACRSLATSNPDWAVDNADSHEYYCENTVPF